MIENFQWKMFDGEYTNEVTVPNYVFLTLLIELSKLKFYIWIYSILEVFQKRENIYSSEI